MPSTDPLVLLRKLEMLVSVSAIRTSLDYQRDVRSLDHKYAVSVGRIVHLLTFTREYLDDTEIETVLETLRNCEKITDAFYLRWGGIE